MRTLLFLAALLLAPCAVAQDGGAPSDTPVAAEDLVRAAVEAANRVFMDAYADGDAEAVAALYTEDTRFWPPGTPALENREAVRAWMQGGLNAGFSRLDFVTEEIYPVGDDMAQEYGHFKLYRGDELANEGRYAVLWKREGETWRMHRDIFNSSLPPDHGDHEDVDHGEREGH